MAAVGAMHEVDPLLDPWGGAVDQDVRQAKAQHIQHKGAGCVDLRCRQHHVAKAQIRQ
jgi:hypothetical protein